MWPCQRRGHNCSGGRGTLGVEFLEFAATVRFYRLSFLRCAPASGSQRHFGVHVVGELAERLARRVDPGRRNQCRGLAK